ncbi:sugar phosphate isomerase/epimerase family protein [Pseudomonas eucalypticola]|uniref:Sugar phosphate isomerase/epimerase n=1 Tax=Pseudomonas eucalypticola TaxID=2599595 RepID=A0A7D5DC19_9PSED|nr:sugar phosphate isomerase/epimerase [Pseudomonas eucalypticola]QKZ07696.1 sugar phosphate isomerase/epimerase [Pseudomonas eucalypticola]
MMALGVAHLTALQLAPADLVRQAAGAGFSAVGLRLHPAMAGGVCYPLEAPARRGLKAVLAEEGMRVADIEFVELTPQVDIQALAPLLEAGADLGAASLTVSGDDREYSRLTDHYAALCQLAAGYGLRVELEFMRWRAVANLAQARQIVEGAGQANGGLLLDALHLFRSGGTVAMLQTIDPRWLRTVQLCDAPLLAPPEEGIIAEAREGRLPPGQGQLPLVELMAALPQGVQVSVEMPYGALKSVERLALAHQATRALLDPLNP